MTKVCTRCDASKELALFARNKGQSSGYDPQCKACHCEKQRLRREAGVDTATRRRRDLMKKYRITPEEWDRMHDEQLGRCAICQTTLIECKKVCVDHCHTTGKVRGLLCSNCNLVLGLFGDDAGRLIRAAQYLMGPSVEEVTSHHEH